MLLFLQRGRFYLSLVTPLLPFFGVCMGSIIADEVGVFRCRYDGIRPCKNEGYFQACLSFERLVAENVLNWESLPGSQYLLHDAMDAHKFSTMQKGHIYFLKMAVGYQKPNSKDGVSYSGGVRYRVLQVLREAGTNE